MKKTMKNLMAAAILAAVSTTAMAQNDWQSRKDRENAATGASSITRNGGRWDERAERDRRYRPNTPRFSAHITSCTGGSCIDEFGNTYSQGGVSLIRYDGLQCTRIGNLVECD